MLEVDRTEREAAAASLGGEDDEMRMVCARAVPIRERSSDRETGHARRRDPRLGSPGSGFALGLADIYVGLALLGLLFAHMVPFTIIDGVVPCTFFVVTGVPCPGCGFTRAFMRAANLDISGALLVSPLGTLLFLGVVAFVLAGIVRLLLRRPWPRMEIGRRGWLTVGISAAALTLANWGYLLVRHLVMGDWA